MKTTYRFTILSAALVSTCLSAPVWGAMFGSGPNTFQIDFISIGNAGNAADTTGDPNPAGSVAQEYRMGLYEVSEQMIDKANTLGGLGITKDARGADKPATSVTWNEAARFVNWLNTSSGYSPAYKFELQPGDAGYAVNANAQLWAVSDPGYDASNLYRNSLAKYFLPSTHEWYKSAYYDAAAGVYFNYPTGSDAAPATVGGGTTAGSAVYGQPFGNGPADITQAGGLSPYGTMGQGGNVMELLESDYNLVNGPSTDARGVRGGYWSSGSLNLLASNRLSVLPTGQGNFIGFRVASTIPEPCTAVLVGMVSLLGFCLRRTR